VRRNPLATAALAAVLAAGASHAGEAVQAATTPAAEPSAAAPAARAPGTESGFFLFQARCTSCHGNPAVERAPAAEALRAMPPERIYTALGPGGIMAGPGASLSDAERRRIAEFMAGRPLGSAALGSAATMSNRCASNSPLADPGSRPLWNGWSSDSRNWRFQPAALAGIAARDVPHLRLKWAFGYPSGVSSNAQPTIASGRIFVGSDNGYLYSLDARSGCVYWSFEAGSIIRAAAVVGRIPGAQVHARYAVFFGDGHANVFALDAQSGKLLWKTRVDGHFVARITAAPRLYRDKLLIPVSSSEGYGAGTPDYPCCTSRGSVVALDAASGRQLWKAWVIAEAPQPYLQQPNGVWLYRPAGGPVWNTPTVDPRQNAVYFGTGDASAGPAPPTIDSVMAVDIDSGRTLWSYQTVAGDVRVGGCTRADPSAACPAVDGPDMDIGNSPLLIDLPGGHRALLFGTKGADILAIDPDAAGRLLYRVNPTGAEPGGIYRAGAPAILWGGATDGHRAYYGLGAGGLAAIDPASGRLAWRFLPTLADGSGTDYLGAAPTVLPGVVFEGSVHGLLYALDAADGNVLWQFDTARSFDTVNGVAAHGGAIAVSGAVAVGGMLYVGSGYAVGNGARAGNLLLAFEASRDRH
jgi:polyvinyl alcohol dehydrogenase (cytochrome)